jgi:uncharacterized membrane protein
MSGDLSKRDWDFGDLLGVVLAMFQERIGVMIGGIFFISLVPAVCFVPAGIMFAMSGFNAGAIEGNPAEMAKLIPAFIAGGVCLIVYLLLYNFLRCGWLSILLKISGGQPAPFSEFFSNANYFMNVLLTTVLMGIVCGVGTIFLIIPGIFLGIKLCWAPFIVVDQNMGPIDAMKASWDMTEGYSVKVLMAGAAYFVINMISSFIPLLGFVAQFLALAFFELTLVALYRAKKGDLVPPG